MTTFHDAFQHFDKTSSGCLSTKVGSDLNILYCSNYSLIAGCWLEVLGQLLKHVGENPSEAEVQDLRLEVDPATTGTFKFPDFLAMMLRKMDENSAEEDIRDSVQQFRYRYFRRAANMAFL